MKKKAIHQLALALLLAFNSLEAMATIAFVQEVGAGSLAAGGATSFSIPVTSPVAVGDVVVLEVVYSGSNMSLSPGIPTDTRGNTYVVRGGAQEVFDDTLATMDYVAAITTELQPGDVITISTGMPPNSYSVTAAAQEFSGVSTTIDNFAVGVARSGGVTTTFATGNIETTNAEDLIYGYVAVQSTEVTGLSQTTSPALSSSAPAVVLNGITLFPLYSIESATGSYGLAGSFATSDSTLPSFAVLVHSLKASAIVSSANLVVSKSHTGNFVQGQTGATYNLSIHNTGMAATTGTITATDTLPAGLSYVSGSGTGWNCASAGHVVTCTSSAPMNGGGSSTLALKVDVAPDSPQLVTNEASIDCTAPCTTSGNPAVDPTTVLAAAPAQTVVATPALNAFGLAALFVLLGIIALVRASQTLDPRKP
jgi:uncharacterized repeat protein (TIGR01451 family)